MSQYKVGVIGTGVMGEAILNGALRDTSFSPNDFYVYDVDREKLINMVDHYAVNACVTIGDLLDQAEIVLLAVKPTVCGKLLEEIAPNLEHKAIISIVAGWSTEKIKRLVPASSRVLCVMPNTPALCGEGMSVFSSANTLNHDELQFALRLFGSFGETEIVDERYFDIVTGVSGSGPAYVFMFIEAMISAGIYNGLPAKTARKLAVQTVLGAAKSLKGTDRHPADMRDAVCTPAGTTIEAVYDLERNGFNGIVMSAVDKCAKKYKQMVSS